VTHKSGYKSKKHIHAWEHGRAACKLGANMKPPYDMEPRNLGFYKAWVAGFIGKDRWGDILPSERKPDGAICDDCGNIFKRAPKKCKCGCTLFKQHFAARMGPLAYQRQQRKKTGR
jgi:hypothetical protein